MKDIFVVIIACLVVYTLGTMIGETAGVAWSMSNIMYESASLIHEVVAGWVAVVMMTLTLMCRAAVCE